MKIRIKFRKYGAMKFVGHLDMMRYFQKAMRRAEIAICYSEGFSPHQIMSFAAPLGVGVTSDGEYLDIEVGASKTSGDAIRDLNAVMADGVEITGYQKLPDNAKTAMSVVAAADYDLFYKEGYHVPASVEQFEEGIEAFFVRPSEVLVTKATKKSEKTMDLKKLVYDFRIRVEDGRPVFYLLLSTGSVDNVKPELVFEALLASMGLVFEADAVQIHRRDVYAARALKADDGFRFCSLGEMGEMV